MKLTFLTSAALVLSVIGFASTAAAQDADPTDYLAWDQAAPSLVEAQAYVYRGYKDGATAGEVLTPVTCAGAASPYACQVLFPAFVPGPHAIAVSAANSGGESLPSVPLKFIFVVVPQIPTSLRMVKQP